MAESSSPACAAWADDSGAVAFVGADHHVRIVELPTGIQTAQWPAGGRPTALSYNRVGRMVAAGFDQPSRVVVFDSVSGLELVA